MPGFVHHDHDADQDDESNGRDEKIVHNFTADPSKFQENQ
jgi:hypothetical protein